MAGAERKRSSRAGGNGAAREHHGSARETPAKQKRGRKPAASYPTTEECFNPTEHLIVEDLLDYNSPAAHLPPEELQYDRPPSPTPIKQFELKPYFSTSDIWLYKGNCLAVLDAINRRYPGGCFDMIFADPPYFLSNGGITCHAGRMVKVDKGEWDKCQGAELNHEFNREWLARCQRALKPNGTIWVSGTHHVIFSVGYAMQQLGFKILNDIAWEKPNPPPNLSCRYFTHSTETILWAAKNEKSKHLFNYQAMRQANGGKQMKTVWRMTAPKNEEKTFGKHPTQKPVALVERVILASTNPGDLVMDPFMGSGTTAVAAVRTQRRICGFEMNSEFLRLSTRRVIGDWDRLVVARVGVSRTIKIFLAPALRSAAQPLPPLAPALRSRAQQKVLRNPDFFDPNDLDPSKIRIDRSAPMSQKPAIRGDRIFHECKFVFLSCAHVSEPSVVHTTVAVDLQTAWKELPAGQRMETTHVVRCETEIMRINNDMPQRDK